MCVRMSVCMMYNNFKNTHTHTLVELSVQNNINNHQHQPETLFDDVDV